MTSKQASFGMECFMASMPVYEGTISILGGITMLCRFKRLLYPKNQGVNPNSYMVGIYQVHEKLVDASGNNITDIKVVGYYLPIIDSILVNMIGHWAKTEKHGTQFEMESFHEVVEASRAGIMSYLASGLIKGIGLKTAEKIYDKFGDKTLGILDNHLDWLTSIPGISNCKLQRIKDSYLASHAARDVVALLTPHSGISPNRAVKIYQHFGVNTLDLLRQNPYRLCEMDGVGFATADRIAVDLGIGPSSPFRIDAGLLYTLKEAETHGHLCMEKLSFIKECVKLLDADGVDNNVVAERAFSMLKDGRLILYGDQVYRTPTANAEIRVAESIKALLLQRTASFPVNLDTDINAEEKKLGLKLVQEQRQAIKSCLASQICIVSGGPGTGKTLIQGVLLNIYKKHNKDAKIVCCAPTGRAARRMQQCTGFPASTIHRALNLFAGEGDSFNQPELIDADLVLVDEVSMLDIYLAGNLLSAIKASTQLVLIGDADQLPSVGPGAVLSELIACSRIPVVKLDKVFRQNAGSRIASNAKQIRHGNISLEYGDDFQFYDSKDYKTSADIIERLYINEVNKHGLDNVALLTPFRSKTETCVNSLNSRLREIINPAAPSKPEAAHGRSLFRLGDKVMQIKNKDDVSNGDVGYITSISKQSDEDIVTVDFGDGRVAEYVDADLDRLELAYACTIHKSQGSEYASVIINIHTGHYIMLKRPLIYTAITRAKARVSIVGQRKALCIAINTHDTERRGTMLALRISGSSASPANI
jgi:exodeoxyribonuclease V alpha subunit